MKRLVSLILIIVLSIALVPTQSLALQPPIRPDYTYVVHSNYADGFLVNTEYLESVGCLPSKYGTGCVPYVIKSIDEYRKVFPYNTLTELADPNYFDNNVVLVINAFAPTLGHEYEITDVYYFNYDYLYVDYNCVVPSEAPDEVETSIIELHINRKAFDLDPSEVHLYTRILHGEWLSRQYELFDIGNILPDISPENYYGVHENPQIIKNAEDLVALTEKYNDDELSLYASELEESFFDEKILLYFLAVAPTQTTEYEVGAVSCDESNNLFINATYDRSRALDTAIQSTLIVIAVPKPETEYASITLQMTERNRKGDVDANGFIETYDYILAKRTYFGTYSLTPAEKSRADVNSDGSVNQYDYILIKRIYFGTYVAD